MHAIIHVRDYTEFNRDTLQADYYAEKLLNEYPYYAGFNNLDDELIHMVVHWCEDSMGSHWELFLKTKNEQYVKVDLMSQYYRFLFGADIDRDGKWEKEIMMIPSTRTLRDVFSH